MEGKKESRLGVELVAFSVASKTVRHLTNRLLSRTTMWSVSDTPGISTVCSFTKSAQGDLQFFTCALFVIGTAQTKRSVC